MISTRPGWRGGGRCRGRGWCCVLSRSHFSVKITELWRDEDISGVSAHCPHTWTRLFQTLQQKPSPQSWLHWPSLHLLIIFWLATTQSRVLWSACGAARSVWGWQGGTLQHSSPDTKSETSRQRQDNVNILSLNIPPATMSSSGGGC